ncbi:MAG: methyltransferase [Bacteroidales bacterium]|nr:methyltransferase [Bacteroidales bacterium]
MNTNTSKVLIKQLIKDKNVGAITTTSNNMVGKIIEKINFSKAKNIVEYGPGNGVITKMLLNNMQNDTVLFVFETNEHFIEELNKINDKRLKIIHSDAEKAKMILKNNYKIENVDFIVSSIPFTFIDKRKRKRIIYKSYNLLKENGKFITYQYSWLIYNLIKKKFSKSSIKSILLNIPPAFIIEGVK